MPNSQIKSLTVGGVTYDIVDETSGYITGMTILSYGHSTWSDFTAAYDANKVVYCRASSNSDPGSGSQTRLAFMAYVDNATTPTNVEFQYYRSMSAHSITQLGDQVFVYKLTNAGTWSVTTRNASEKEIVVSGSLTRSWSNDVLTLTGTDTNYIPTGGTTGQVLAKKTDTNYDLEWISAGSGSGTVTSVAVSNDTNGGLSVSGSPITSTGTITIGHSNVLTNAQTTSAVYPIKIDKNGHISEYGSAVTIPTKVSDLSNDSGFVTTDEKLAVTVNDSDFTNRRIVFSSTSTAASTKNISNLLQLDTYSSSPCLEIGGTDASSNKKSGILRLYNSYGGSVAIRFDNSSTATYTREIYIPNKGGTTVTLATTDDIPSVPTGAASATTGISIADHSTDTIYGVTSSTTSVTGVQSSTTTASKVTLGTAISVPNVTDVGSASTWAFENVTVPKAATSATTVPTAASSATTVPIKNAEATSIPNVTAAGSGSFTQGAFSGGSFTSGAFDGGSFTSGAFSGGSLTMAINGTDSKQLDITFTAATHASDSFTAATHAADSFTAATHGSDSHTHTAPTIGTPISIYGVQSSTTSVTGVSGSTSVTGVQTGTGSTVTASHVTSGSNGSVPTLGTAISVPNVTAATDVTVPIKNTSATTVPIKDSSSTTVVTSKTHSVTDTGHTHSLS